MSLRHHLQAWTETAALAALILSGSGTAVAGAASFAFEATVETLDNGMKVILVEDHSAAVVSRWTFYRVGSRNERPGITGISHYIEHMMFNGAAKYGPKEFDRILEASGGSSNAYTGPDFTAYYEDASRDILELCIDLDSDRMRSLAFEPEVSRTEMSVVQEERLMSVDNSVDGTLFEQLYALAYHAHPYSWDVIGWMSDLKAITRDDAAAYWRRYYAPNNAILVIVGDFKTPAALELVRRYYGDIPAQAPPEPVRTVEPEQLGERRAVVRKTAELPALMAAYHIPAVTHPDIYALDLLQYVLGAGESSRLYRKLVRELEVAADVWAGADWRIDPGLFVTGIQLQPERLTVEAEAALYAEIEAIVARGVSDAELEKARNRLLAGFYGGIETVNGRADAIGTYEIYFGDYTELFRTHERYQAVTAADVQRVAGAYLRADNRSVVTLQPEG